MEFTIIGLITALLGLALIRAPASAMVTFLLICSVMGAASAINLPVLGGASIPPVYFAMAFLWLRLIASPLNMGSALLWSLRTNLFLALFVAYGVVAALVFPRMFDGQVELAPMRLTASTAGAIYATDPLHLSAQNVTQALYLVGTLLAAAGTAIAARVEEHGAAFVNAVMAAAWIHIATGLLDLLFSWAGLPNALDWLRNGNYAQLNQTWAGFHRISGLFPEPSSYAIYGFMLLVFSTELWLRNVRPRTTGLTSLGMTLVLILSTSSTAYISLGAYAALLLLRLFFVAPSGRSVIKSLYLISGLLVASTVFVAITLVRSDLAQSLVNIVQEMTTQKVTTVSAAQRAFWARQGLEAFQASGGLGVGPGSFRSSSLITAILGSVGVAGATSFVLYIIWVLKPHRPASHDLNVAPLRAVAASAGWAAVVGLAPAAVAAAGPDPGFLFAVFSGVALAWSDQRLAALGTARPWQVRRGGPPLMFGDVGDGYGAFGKPDGGHGDGLGWTGLGRGGRAGGGFRADPGKG